MASPYAGTNVFPSDFLVPADDDGEDASSVNIALEALGDRTVFNKQALADYLANKSPRMRIQTFNASGTYIPDSASRIVAAWVIGCGGGGAGGNGDAGPNTNNIWLAGAGGGGGAIKGVHPVVIIPGSTYNVDIGAGGATNAGPNNAPNTGGDGGSTIFRIGASNLAIFPGAQGGKGPFGGHALTGVNTYAMGGTSRAGTPTLVFGVASECPRFDTTVTEWLTTTIEMPLQPAQGGYGADGSTHPLASAGNRNPFGDFAGGAAGVRGADSGSYKGGGGGGGGGAGPFGAGAAGANGGAATSAADSAAGGAANTGAGGGGGGTGGGNSSTGTGYGGAGGSGKLILVTILESP